MSEFLHFGGNMENKNECFCVKHEGKNYCRCLLSLSPSDASSEAFLFAENIFSSLHEFCERIYEYEPKEERLLRERFNIVPYSFCANISVAAVSERLSFVRIEYCYRARFPGGNERKGIRGFAFDEKLSLPLFPNSIKYLSAFSDTTEKKINFNNIFLENDRIKLASDDGVLFVLYENFEKEYLVLVKNKKRSKPLDNFEKK